MSEQAEATHKSKFFIITQHGWPGSPGDTGSRAAAFEYALRHDDRIVYAIWQYEEGEGGARHIQAYIVLSERVRVRTLNGYEGFGHCSIFARQGSHLQAKQYCSKEDTRRGGPWERGSDRTVPRRNGERSDIQALRYAAASEAPEVELWDAHFGPMLRYYRAVREYRVLRRAIRRTWKTQVHVYYGATGSGKSHAVQLRSPDGYWVQQPAPGATLWWDGYNGTDDVVIDEYFNWIQLTLFLRLLDQYPLDVQTKGGRQFFAPKRIFITSNIMPESWYPNCAEVHRAAMMRRLDHIVCFNAAWDEERGYDITIKKGEFIDS